MDPATGADPSPFGTVYAEDNPGSDDCVEALATRAYLSPQWSNALLAIGEFCAIDAIPPDDTRIVCYLQAIGAAVPEWGSGCSGGSVISSSTHPFTGIETATTGVVEALKLSGVPTGEWSRRHRLDEYGLFIENPCSTATLPKELSMFSSLTRLEVEATGLSGEPLLRTVAAWYSDGNEQMLETPFPFCVRSENCTSEMI